MTPDQIGLQDNSGMTALHYASNKGPQVIEYLCQHMTNDQIGLQDEIGYTALHSAIKNNSHDKEGIGFLCHYMTEDQVGLVDEFGQTALHYACYSRTADEQVVQVLCQSMKKNRVALENKAGQTALFYVCDDVFLIPYAGKKIKILTDHFTTEQLRTELKQLEKRNHSPEHMAEIKKYLTEL